MQEGPILLVIIALAVIFIVVSTARFKLHPFLALLLAGFGVGLAVNMPVLTIVETINSGFGNLMGYIGLVVVLGTIIGVVLEKSGAALQIADLVIRAVGPNKPSLAMSLIGLLVGIPVFCDSGFIILSGINRALTKRSKVPMGALALALASGLYTSHTLIPPTPGPIAAAGNLGASDYLGTVILLGLIISVPVVFAAYFYAIWFGKKVAGNIALEENEEIISTSDANLKPGVIKSLAPIVVPILLISLASLAKILPISGQVQQFIQFLGLPLVALFIGILLCMPLLPAGNKGILNTWVGDGILQAGPILILTGAGGAFGAILKATPISGFVSSWVTGNQTTGSIFLLIAFLIAALLKTSQGSTTSAMVITSSMLAPLLVSVGFNSPVELSLLVMAIGGGAMVVSHANDSYFWVITQFSGLAVKDAYRGFTVVTLLQGLVTLAMTLLLFYILT